MALEDFYYGGTRPEQFKTAQQVREHFSSLLSRRSAWVSVDTETVSLTDLNMLGVGIATSADDSFYFPGYSDLVDLAMLVMQHPGIVKVFHNSMFDLKVIRQNKGLIPFPVYDTLQAAKFHGLPGKMKELARGFGWEIDDIQDMLIEAGEKDLLGVPESIVADKCLWDIRATYRFWEIVDKETPRAMMLEDGHVQKALTKMTFKGIRTDREMAASFRSEIVDEIESIRQECYDAYEFNPGSTEHVAYVLNMEGVFLPIKRPDKRKGETWETMKKTKFTADKEALKAVEHLSPWVPKVLRYRELTKIDGTYLRPYLNIDRIHPDYNMGPRSSRLAGRNPNPMNVPKKYRPIFVPDNGYWTRFDCNQQEIRILAYMSGDKKMNAILQQYDETLDPSLKFHSVTAEMMGCNYDDGKTTTFTLVYGGEDETIASRANTTVENARKLKDMWKRTYPDAWAWMEAVKVLAKRNGYVETADGRKLWLPNVEQDPEGEAGMERKAVNYPIQGTGASILRKAIVKFDIAEENNWPGMDVRIPVHDELDNDGVIVDHPNIDELIEGLYTPWEKSYHARWGEDEADLDKMERSEEEKEEEELQIA